MVRLRRNTVSARCCVLRFSIGAETGPLVRFAARPTPGNWGADIQASQFAKRSPAPGAIETSGASCRVPIDFPADENTVPAEPEGVPMRTLRNAHILLPVLIG